MTSHNETSEKQKWQIYKANLIARFGTIKAAAAIFDCHPNALRGAATGKCPRVAKRVSRKLKQRNTHGAEVLSV